MDYELLAKHILLLLTHILNVNFFGSVEGRWQISYNFTDDEGVQHHCILYLPTLESLEGEYNGRGVEWSYHISSKPLKTIKNLDEAPEWFQDIVRRAESKWSSINPLQR